VTRLLAPSWGALLTYASIEKGKESAPGQFQAAELQEIYSIDRIQPDTRYYGVLGYPLGHSLSPHIHNAAFRQLGLNCRYFPLPVRELQDFASSMDCFSGLSITLPYKQEIARFAQMVDDSVHETGAANTLVQQQGGWVAYNTDLDGIELALQSPLRAGISTAVLLGAGGAARAAAAFLKRKGCQVVVLGRDLQKVKAFAQFYGFGSGLLPDISNHAADLLINATPVGMAPLIEHSPLPADALQFKYVFDMVYNPLETRLLKLAREKGCQTISGLEMFIGQAARQFELWTAYPAPVDLMRETALQQLQPA
jgi:3-dehydroquinate dehydratase / shikimate dehydrogenase